MAITQVANMGVAQAKTSTTSTVITTVAAATGGTDRVVVAFSMDPAAGTVSCADSAGNTYIKGADVTQGSGTSGVRTMWFTAWIATTLPIGGTITISHPAAVARAGCATNFRGTSAQTGALCLDGTVATNNASSGSPTVTKSDHSATGERLFIAGLGEEGPTQTISSAGWSGGQSVSTSGNPAASNMTTMLHYKIATNTGSLTYAPTQASNPAWAVGLHAIGPTGFTFAPAFSGTVTGSSATAGTVTGKATRAGTTSGSAVTSGTVTGKATRIGTGSGSTTTGGTVTGKAGRAGTVSGTLATGGTVSGKATRLGTTSGSTATGGSVIGSAGRQGSVAGVSASDGTVVGTEGDFGSVLGGTVTGGSVTGTRRAYGSVDGSTVTGGSASGSAGGDAPPPTRRPRFVFVHEPPMVQHEHGTVRGTTRSSGRCVGHAGPRRITVEERRRTVEESELVLLGLL